MQPEKRSCRAERDHHGPQSPGQTSSNCEGCSGQAIEERGHNEKHARDFEKVEQHHEGAIEEALEVTEEEKRQNEQREHEEKGP